MSERLFPIMDGPAIPWRLIAPHEGQARRNHDQSLERLAERGGLGVLEAVAVFQSKPWREVKHLSDGEALSQLRAIIDADARAEGFAAGVEKSETATRAVFARWARTEYGLLLSDVLSAIRALKETT